MGTDKDEPSGCETGGEAVGELKGTGKATSEAADSLPDEPLILSYRSKPGTLTPNRVDQADLPSHAVADCQHRPILRQGEESYDYD